MTTDSSTEFPTALCVLCSYKCHRNHWQETASEGNLGGVWRKASWGNTVLIKGLIPEAWMQTQTSWRTPCSQHLDVCPSRMLMYRYRAFLWFQHHSWSLSSIYHIILLVCLWSFVHNFLSMAIFPIHIPAKFCLFLFSNMKIFSFSISVGKVYFKNRPQLGVPSSSQRQKACVMNG